MVMPCRVSKKPRAVQENALRISGDAVSRSLAAGACYLGPYSLKRRLLARKRLTSIFYHDVVSVSPLPEIPLFIDRETFWQHIDRLAGQYTFIGLGDLVSRSAIPRYPLFLSFDGYSREYLAVAEALSARGLKATFYLITEPIQRERPHWVQRLYYVFRHLKAGRVAVELGGNPFSVEVSGTPSGNMEASRTLHAHMDSLADPYAMVEELAKRYGVSMEKFDVAYPPLTVEEVARLAALPGIEVGSHSHRHITRPDLDDASAREEIEVSKGLLDKWTGKPVAHYAYPSGRVPDRMPRLLEQAGYQTAATTVAKLHRPYVPPEWPYRIPRYCVHNGPFYRLAGQIAGVHKVMEVLSRLRHRKGGMHGRQPEDAGY